MDRNQYNELVELIDGNYEFFKPTHKRTRADIRRDVNRKKIIGINIFLVSHGVRPGFGFYANIYECLCDEVCSKIFTDFFDKYDLPVGIYDGNFYNTNIFTSRTIKQRKTEDGAEYFGRIFGYPEPFTDEEFNTIGQTFYGFGFIVDSEYIFGYYTKNNNALPSIEYIRNFLEKINIIGLETLTIEIYFVVRDETTEPVSLGKLVYKNDDFKNIPKK